MEEFIFKLTTTEADRIISALNEQTQNLITKLQTQYAEQVHLNNKEEIKEENNGN